MCSVGYAVPSRQVNLECIGLNLPPGSDMSCQSEVNMKPAAVPSSSEFEVFMPEIEKPGEGIRDFGESSVQFAHVSSNIFNFIRC